MVADSTAAIARVVHVSVNPDVHALDQTYLGYVAHFQNNAIKHFIANRNIDSVLQAVAADFRAVKRIVEVANGCRWNESFLIVTA